jgi:ATP-dependent exoDNAse (exonuclease V) beta subunit
MVSEREPTLSGPVSADEPPSWDRVDIGASIGRAVHAVLQSIDLATGDGLDAVAAASAASELVPDHAAVVAQMARAALGSGVVRGGCKRRHWREVYVATPVGSSVIEGFIDLLVDGPDGMEVVDFKTERLISDADVDQAVAHHSLQMAGYALCVKGALGARVARCVLVFLAGGVARERVVSNLEMLESEVRSRLDAANVFH